MNAEILCVGTELLLGDIVNTDAAYLARRLSEIGIPLYRTTVVGDNAVRLRAALEESYSRADLVILTGGLGPTADDITKEVTAEFFGLRLVEDLPSYEAMKTYFTGLHRTMTVNNLKQIMMPAGCTIFPNGCGTAPGCAIEQDGRTAVLLPGPPSELEMMTERSLVPYLERYSEGVLYSLNLHLNGIGESAAEAKVADLVREAVNPSVAPYAGDGECRIRITARGKDAAEAKAMAAEMRETVLARGLAEYLYTETDTTEALADPAAWAVISALRKRGWMMAAAESCTGGMIGTRITNVSGASAVFAGSFVTYSNEVKHAAIGVSNETLSAHGAVSEETAAEMAAGAKRVSGADIAVSTTGIAGPTGGTPEKPVGTVCFGLALPDGTVRAETMHFNPRAPRDRIRKQASSHALRLILRAAES